MLKKDPTHIVDWRKFEASFLKMLEGVEEMHPYILEKLKIKVEDNVFEIDFDYLTFEGEEDDDMLSSDQTDLLSD